MGELFSRVYIQYLDYMLFSFGMIFIGISVALFAFKRHRYLWMKENPMFVIILYFLLMGIMSWIDLIFLVSNKFYLPINIHFYLYLFTYLVLFELGRRLLFFKKKCSFLLYIIPIIIIIINIQYDKFYMVIALVGSLMTGLGFYKWIKEGTINSELKSAMNKLLYLPFFILSTAYFLFLFISIFTGSSFESFHWIKHLVEWSFQLLFGIVLIFHIVNVRIKNQFDYQLKDALISIVKRTMFLILGLFIVGFFVTTGFGRLAFEKDIDKLHSMSDVIVSSISKSTVLHLIAKDNIELYYPSIQKHLTDIQKQKKRVTGMDVLVYRNGGFEILVNSSTEFENFSLGEMYTDKNNLLLESYKEKIVTHEEVISKGEEGNYLSIYSPIYSSIGSVLAVLKIDITEDSILEPILNYRIIIISILSGIILFIFILAPIQYLYQREKIWLKNYQGILSSIDEFICIFDENGEIIYVNEAMSELTGYMNEGNSDNSTRKLGDIVSANNNKLDSVYIIDEIKKKDIYYDEIIIHDISGNMLPLFISVKILGKVKASSLYVFVGMNIAEQKRRINDMQNYSENTLSLLATVVDAKDKYTLKHSSNVAKYARGIGQELGFSQEKLNEIAKASMLHDIGKIYIPDNILNKVGPLDGEEWNIVKKHPEQGMQILEKAGSTMEHLIPYVYYHHERYDGKGYPTGMKEQPLEISVITLADAFDAMSSDRSYRKGMSIEEIKNEISKNSGTQFHPEVVNAFFRYVEGIITIDELDKG